MKRILLFMTLLSMPLISVFADHDRDRDPGRDHDRDHGRWCRNAEQISYQAAELARETRQLSQVGRGWWGNRWSDEARRLEWASMDLSIAARNGNDCRNLERMFSQSVEPAFRNLQEEVRGPRREDMNRELRDVIRAYQDLKRELFDDGRGPGRDRDPGRWPGGGPLPYPRH